MSTISASLHSFYPVSPVNTVLIKKKKIGKLNKANESSVCKGDFKLSLLVFLILLTTFGETEGQCAPIKMYKFEVATRFVSLNQRNCKCLCFDPDPCPSRMSWCPSPELAAMWIPCSTEWKTGSGRLCSSFSPASIRWSTYCLWTASAEVFHRADML